jgi:hypothetical protein
MVELIDFIYRDADRIASLSAQLFRGNLISHEVTKAGKDGKESGLGLAAVVTGSHKATSEYSRSEKETRQPHDVATTDLLAKLIEAGRIHSDVTKAPQGGIIRAVGTLHLIDGGLLGIAGKVLEGFSIEGLPNEISKAVGSIMQTIEMPTGFLLDATIVQIVGTLKPDGLSEPLIATYFKHGDAGLAEVEVVGILEKSSQEPVSVLGSQFFTATKLYTQKLGDLLFPTNGIRITPLVIFRKVG